MTNQNFESSNIKEDSYILGKVHKEKSGFSAESSGMIYSKQNAKWKKSVVKNILYSKAI